MSISVQCRGERHSTKEMASNLTQVIDDLIIRFPKFSQHIKGLNGIYIYDCFQEDDKFINTRNAAGIYFNRKKEICIAINEAYNIQLAVHTLLHEIGHHMVHRKIGIDQNYNSVSKNKAYYKEEIRAEKYAMFIIDKFFVKDYPALRFLGFFNKFQSIKDDIIQNIKSFKEKMVKLPTSRQRLYYPSYTTVSPTWIGTGTGVYTTTATTVTTIYYA